MYRRGLDVIIPKSEVFAAADAHDIDRLKKALETEEGKRDAVDFVCPYTNRTPLIAASEDACIHCAEELLKNGADVNKPGNRLRTPLMAAAANKREDVLELLLKAGADVTMQDDEGQTALMFACFAGTTRAKLPRTAKYTS